MKTKILKLIEKTEAELLDAQASEKDRYKLVQEFKASFEPIEQDWLASFRKSNALEQRLKALRELEKAADEEQAGEAVQEVSRE